VVIALPDRGSSMPSLTWQILRRLPAIGTDAVIVLASYALALALRFDGSVPRESWAWFAWAVPLIALGYIFANTVFGVYRTAWQYGSTLDAIYLGLAVSLVTVIAFGVNRMLENRPLPLSVNLMSGVFIFLFMGLVKLSPRLLVGGSLPFMGWTKQDAQRVLIVGAGNTGQLLAREMRQNREWDYRPVCFVDDDPRKRGMRVHGVPVMGNRQEIPALVEKMGVNLVALAIPSAHATTIEEILALCEATNVAVRIVPGVQEIVSGRARPSELREVTTDDLVARDPVEVDFEACRQALHGRSVLITGAAGSIGAELARRVLDFEPSAIHLFDASEGGLHELRLRLMQLTQECQVRPWLGSIADQAKVAQVFAAARPQVVFHCAAYKHVPLVQEHPDQAFKVNILGTLHVFQAAQRWGSEKAVFLSSHTAVNPSSVMGASKRVGELMVKSMGRHGNTALAAIRLTNVIDTRGGVVTVFARQIQKGGPLSVTHPDMARYFLTLHEVTTLIIQVAAQAQGGEVFVLDVGDEIRIVDLAERMIRSQGMEPGRDVEIVYTGLRPGEKLREDLVAKDEEVSPTGHPKVFEVKGGAAPSVADLLAEIDAMEAHPPESAEQMGASIHALARLDQSRIATPITSERLT
jgi:FlaA1/EpsC-like NDP-sugar epimerase